MTALELIIQHWKHWVAAQMKWKSILSFTIGYQSRKWNLIVTKQESKYKKLFCALVSNWELKANCIAIQLEFTFLPILAAAQSSPQTLPQTIKRRDDEKKSFRQNPHQIKWQIDKFSLSIFCTYFTPVENSISLNLSLVASFFLSWLDLIVSHNFLDEPAFKEKLWGAFCCELRTNKFVVEF